MKYIVFIFLFYSTSIYSQSVDKEKLSECINSIYEMNWSKAKSNLNSYYHLYPNHTSRFLIKAYYLRWKHYPILENSKELYTSYLSILDSARTAAETALKSDRSNLEEAYYKMTSHIMKAEVHALNEDMVKAAMEGKSAFGIIKKGFEWCKENPEFYISTGLYNYYIEFYRDKGFFYQSLLWPFSKGDRQKGLDYLYKGSIEATFSRVENEIYLAHLNFKMQNNPTLGLSYISKLRKQFPNNTKFAEMEVENLIALEKLSAARKSLQLLEKSNDKYIIVKGQLFGHIIGISQRENIAKNTLGLTKVVEQFDKMLGDQEHYLSLAYLYLGVAEKGLKNEDKAEDYFNKAKKYAKYPYLKEKLEQIESL